MRAWTILMFLIIFTVFLNVVGYLGVFGAPRGENIFEYRPTEFMKSVKNFDFLNVLSISMAGLAIIGGVFLRLNVGAVVYAGIFSANVTVLDVFFDKLSGFEGGFISGPLETTITIAIAFTFLWGFIKLS